MWLKNKGITTSTTTKKNQFALQITLIKFNYLSLLKLTSAWLNKYLTPEKRKSILFYLKKQTTPPMYFFVDCVKTVIILSSQIDNGLHQKEKKK